MINEAEKPAASTGEAAPVDAVVMLPCPFCGSSKIREVEMMFCDDDGEHPGAECLNCDAINRREFWNMRNDSCN